MSLMAHAQYERGQVWYLVFDAHKSCSENTHFTEAGQQFGLRRDLNAGLPFRSFSEGGSHMRRARRMASRGQIPSVPPESHFFLGKGVFLLLTHR